MLRFVCIALALVAARADDYDLYGKGKGIIGGGGVNIGGVGIGPGGAGGIGVGGAGIIGPGIGLGGGAGIIGPGIGLGGNVVGNINSLGGVNTFASGLQGTSPAFRGAVQGAATGSALGVLSGRPSQVSGVSVGVGGGQALVSGNVRPIGGGYPLPGVGPIIWPGGPIYPQRDVATFSGNTIGNLASGSVNSLTGGFSAPYGGYLGLSQGGYGYGLNLGGYGYGNLGLGNIGIGGLGLGLGNNVFSGVSQSLPGGNAVLSGQAFGPALGNIPAGGSVNFGLGGVGPIFPSIPYLPGPILSPGLTGVPSSSIIAGPAVNIQAYKKKVY